MQLDRELLSSRESELLLHLYDWEGECATFGHFISPEAHLDLEEAARRGLRSARRPTGGGITFHLFDLTFSLFVPAAHPCCSSNTLENYRFVQERVKAAVEELFGCRLDLFLGELPRGRRADFCAAHPAPYDLMQQGKKVAGGAQRRTKAGFLHQGSLFLKAIPESYLKTLLKEGSPLAREMLEKSSSLLKNPSPSELLEAKSLLQKKLVKFFSI